MLVFKPYLQNSNYWFHSATNDNQSPVVDYTLNLHRAKLVDCLADSLQDRTFFRRNSIIRLISYWVDTNQGH